MPCWQCDKAIAASARSLLTQAGIAEADVRRGVPITIVLALASSLDVLLDERL